MKLAILAGTPCSCLAEDGHEEFVIALGPRGEVIKKYILGYSALKTGKVWMEGGAVPDWTVELGDTGIKTATGGDDTHFEREPLERLAAAGQLMAYRHDAFWRCMDTLHEKRYLDRLWDSGEAPWKTWSDAWPEKKGPGRTYRNRTVGVGSGT
jgi:NDP-sugar pyrophosphorylase family protein